VLATGADAAHAIAAETMNAVKDIVGFVRALCHLAVFEQGRLVAAPRSCSMIAQTEVGGTPGGR
jgi:hypothetical protein